MKEFYTWLTIFILSLTGGGHHHCAYALEDALDLINVGKDIGELALEAWDIINENSDHERELQVPFLESKTKRVLTQIDKMKEQLSLTEGQHTENILAALQSMRAFALTDTVLSGQMQQWTVLSDKVSTMYNTMKQFHEHERVLSNDTLVKFARWAVEPNAESVNYILSRMHLVLFGDPDRRIAGKNFLTQLVENYEMNIDQLCLTQQSAQQFVYSLFADITLTELKGYIICEYSWMILQLHGEDHHTELSKINRKSYQQRLDETTILLHSLMKTADRTIWRCDPDQFISGKTYDEVTRLLQGYIENEIDLNGDQTCREECSYYENTKSHGCYKNEYCAHQPRCSGRIYDCTYVDSDMSVCQANTNSSRRYEYVQYNKKSSVLGKRRQCSTTEFAVTSWYDFPIYQCSYCVCLCDEMGLKSDRYFSLHEVSSDITNNKIVTGLRFIKHKRIFHLQIQQAELLPRGAVNISTPEWKSIESFAISDRNITNGVDYFTLNYSNRSIDLDDIHTDDLQYVLTGLRFRILGAHLNLEACFTEFDFDTGKLSSAQNASYWKSIDNTDISGNKRKRIKLSSPDASIRSTVKSLPLSRDNQFVEFTNSNLHKDAAQSTVPFIDIQNVISNPPVPLSGVGIYLKGRVGYGGFVAPKIMTYDFTSHSRIQHDKISIRLINNKL